MRQKGSTLRGSLLGTKGFANTLVIALLLLVVVAGGTYYLGWDQGFEKAVKQQDIASTPSTTSAQESSDTANWKTRIAQHI